MSVQPRTIVRPRRSTARESVRRLLALSIVLTVTLAGCGGGTPSTTTPSPSQPAVTSAASASAGQPGATSTPSASATPGTNRVQHVFLIVMENKEYGQIIGNSAAPYINKLASQYAVADAYYAVTHPSLPNYLALFGGDTYGIRSDCTDCFVDQPNLADSLDAAGKTWKSYQEDLPSPCFLGAQSGNYAMKHDPFLYFQDIRSNPTRCRNVVPLTQLTKDLAANQVPNFAWITPNLIHDMHNGTIAQGDSWLAGFVPKILASPAWKDGGVLVIVWDEGTTSLGCCGADGGRVPLLVISPTGPFGYRSPIPATHYFLLRAIENLWGLHLVGKTGNPGVQGLPTLFP